MMICSVYISGQHGSPQSASGQIKAILGQIGSRGLAYALTSAVIVTAITGCPGQVKGDVNHPLYAIDIHQIKLGGMISRQVDTTINNNLLVLDYEKDFLGPFKAKSSDYGFIDLGNVIDAIARLAWVGRHVWVGRTKPCGATVKVVGLGKYCLMLNLPAECSIVNKMKLNGVAEQV